MTAEDLVRAVAERVMGWPVSCQQPDGFWWVNPTPDDVPIGYGVLHPFDPLQWDGDACMVLDKMVEKGFAYSVREFRPYADEEWERRCVIYYPGRIAQWAATAETRRRAICLAALKAVSGE